MCEIFGKSRERGKEVIDDPIGFGRGLLEKLRRTLQWPKEEES